MHALDAAVDGWAGVRRTAVRDRVFFPLSSAADHSLLWLALGSARAVRRHDPGFTYRFGLAMAVESAVTNGVLKSLFRRRRPGRDLPDGPLPYGVRRPITSAFPSGHATAAFTAAPLLAAGDPLGPLYYGLAALVAASRVYVGLHHTSDVLVGAALGLAFGLVARRFVAPSHHGGMRGAASRLALPRTTGRFP